MYFCTSNSLTNSFLMEPALIKASRLKLRLKRDHLFNSMLSFAQMGFNLLRVLPGEVADVMTGIGGGGGVNPSLHQHNRYNSGKS